MLMIPMANGLCAHGYQPYAVGDSRSCAKVTDYACINEPCAYGQFVEPNCRLRYSLYQTSKEGISCCKAGIRFPGENKAGTSRAGCRCLVTDTT